MQRRSDKVPCITVEGLDEFQGRFVLWSFTLAGVKSLEGRSQGPLVTERYGDLPGIGEAGQSLTKW